ncbi:NHL repeat-containing protein [Bythopirellula goksoeyrii]|uniref:Serine/threonine-protein kinase PknD n=1 Tax=Bythopirellula goksoeyrii TaxID=1400387 RepID=A0A5B9QL78_9BACT|nr:NHL repeat-containing protein [Bythopirellula goksoeyrii]QEG34891.1 Serine/threonine-protein kinase PknD [Bythopirellula goksoeyrii]
MPKLRLHALLLHCFLILLGLAVGCVPHGDRSEAPDLVWGLRGISSGRFQKPRAIAVDDADRLYIVDMTARIQVFDVDGTYLHGWHTPESANGRPSGLTIDRQGRLLVADTHYYQMLVYDSEGNEIPEAKIGGTMGHGPGEFGFVTDAVEDSQGNYYVAEYGDFDRIQKFSPEGEYLLEWGGPGEEPGQFRRPQNLAIDAEDRIWVVDACNHRVQVFDTEGMLLDCWGSEGSEPGKLYYPYDLVLDGKGHIYICEYGNHRIQKFTLDGNSLGCWGSQGRESGQLNNPWALARDSQGRLHVLDSNNHRVQRIIF